MIRYETKNDAIQVYLFTGIRDLHVGTIKAHGGGYRYEPKGGQTPGDVMDSIVSVKCSIEAR